jgi:hypothetical protein
MNWLLIAILILVGAAGMEMALSPFRPHPSDTASLAENHCLDARGIPTFDGWTGFYTGCVWPRK